MEQTITVKIDSMAELAAAVNRLATALMDHKPIAPEQPVAPAKTDSPGQITGDDSALAAEQTQATEPAASAIPTTAAAQHYTQDQIAVAMAGLIDAGKIADIQSILGSFGVEALTQIPAEQYPALVTQLKQIGAQL